MYLNSGFCLTKLGIIKNHLPKQLAASIDDIYELAKSAGGIGGKILGAGGGGFILFLRLLSDTIQLNTPCEN